MFKINASVFLHMCQYHHCDVSDCGHGSSVTDCPHCTWYGAKPGVEHLSFWCTAYVHVPNKDEIAELDSRPGRKDTKLSVILRRFIQQKCEVA